MWSAASIASFLRLGIASAHGYGFLTHFPIVDKILPGKRRLRENADHQPVCHQALAAGFRHPEKKRRCSPHTTCASPLALLLSALPTAYCLLPTAYCLLPTARCLLQAAPPTARCLLQAALPTPSRLLPKDTP